VTSSLDADRLAVLVHEVRSPVAALSAIAETFAASELDADARRALVRLVLVGCDGIRRIVADASVASIRLETVDPIRLVQDVVAASVLRGGSVRLTSPERGPSVQADSTRLRQVLDNLIANALLHGSSNEPVLVTLTIDASVRIAVSDAGSGISPAESERIFEPGVRLDPAATAGAGLGLALARTIVEGHGGSLEVESSPGTGATFTVSLPVAPP
jgi:signal transduction histidine kinase